MPATRKSSRASSGTGKQSTLSFNHRVTKTVAKSAKDIAKPSPLSKQYPAEPEAVETKDIVDEEVLPSPQPEEETPEVPEKTELELKAEKISGAAIERYWSKIDSARTAKAVHKKHTEGLTTGEKVLRYFDVSSQYGVSLSAVDLRGRIADDVVSS